ncbi:MAG TPA: 4'-phosphopantetheinyl transferase superfamily protein [Opitutaceae bacterium]|nr:4'-phosphopantetheinyl transferase superfamily protein [Opitutaceae bacterium]
MNAKQHEGAINLHRDTAHCWFKHLGSDFAWIGLRSGEHLGNGSGKNTDAQRNLVSFRREAVTKWRQRVIGRYLGLAPEAVEFETTPEGKPLLRAEINSQRLSVSFSQTVDACALILCRERLVGIDVENVSTEDLPLLAQTYLSQAELGAFQKATPAEQPLTFYRFWTQKEAYLKALGVGLDRPPREVEIVQTSVAGVVFSGDSRLWQLDHLKPWPHTLACALVEGASVEIQTFFGEPAQ